MRENPKSKVTVVENRFPPFFTRAFVALLNLAVPLGVLALIAWTNWRHHSPVSFLNNSLPEVVQALKSGDAGTRSAAARELSRRGDAAAIAIPELTDALHDANGAVVSAAADTLKRFGSAAEPALPDLLAALEHSEYAAARAASFAIVSLLGERAVPAMLEGADRRPPQARAVIAQGLARLGTGARSAEPQLLQWLDDEDATVRRMAALAAGKSGLAAAVPRLMPLLHDPAPFVAEDATTALGDIGPDAAPAGEQLLQLFRQDWQREASAAEALGGIGPAAAPLTAALFPLLKADRESQRYLAAYVLRRIGTPAARQALDGYAAQAVPEYVALLEKRDAAPVPRLFAAKALGYIGRPDTFDLLARALEDSAIEVRQEAALALGFFGDQRGVPVLIAAMNRNGTEAGNAQSALIRLGTPEALAAVREHQREH